MKRIILIIVLCYAMILKAQENTQNLAEFTLSSGSTPAFLLVEESPTAIYTPENLRALVIHALDNLGESISIEFTPYFFIGKPNRTYYNYVGLKAKTKDESFTMDMSSKNIGQDIFSSALKNLSISAAYVDKEFSGIGAKRKTYSIGARSTLIKVFSNGSKEKIVKNATTLSHYLSGFIPSDETNAIVLNAKSEEEKKEAAKRIAKERAEWDLRQNQSLDEFRKIIKPSFRVDAALGYSALFKENEIDSGTANRFGSWLTAEASVLLNDGADSKTNNYFNLFLTARYIEDGFNINASNDYFTNYYRDFGGKIEFEFGKFGFSYEYISRKGAIDSERSVGNIKYIINKDLSLIGGFGKDFPENDNLVTIFGLNFGLNLGKKSVSLKQ